MYTCFTSYIRYIQVTVSILAVFFCTQVEAATDSFTIQTVIDADEQAPSIPLGLIGTPVTTSQVDLAWMSSTDNTGTVSGYHVWRDDMLIGTTVGTTYSDTGLMASTTYLYYVTAFDPYINESASSTSINVTTLASASIEGGVKNAIQYGSVLASFDEMITGIEVIPGKDTVYIRYTTTVPVQANVQWGKSISYELGSSVEQTFLTKHEIGIINLSLGTTYAFSIHGYDSLGRSGNLYQGTFTTLLPDDTFAPGNVTNFIASREENDVLLSWINPNDPDFTKVRVLRNDRFYPSDTADGWVVYEGNEPSVRDAGGVTGTQQFYTIFTYDTLGNVSSGAVTSIRFMEGHSTTTVSIIDQTKNDIQFSFEDVFFVQDGVTIYPNNDGAIHIDGAKQLTVSIPYDKLPDHLKTILVTIGDSRNNAQTFSFLLRVDTERTVYTGTLAPFGVGGDFPVTISVFDYATTQIGYTGGVLTASIRPIHSDSSTDDTVAGFFDFAATLGKSYVTWFSFLLVLLVFVTRRLLHKSL